ncbi:hypothetical protein EV383_4438 [Pseudonocardia sediminis]|uniref:Uncharacterized protein n=1 Tax=Pseudonocardia sediminis TaxID=1397368 RepID=A0A4Q7V465_PSEST|nr:hypothetical protein [Pseudonocardia sediminis]RZT87513.1 hypothetical protein EV383_4438 [Pseudonocardia sediminis]
MNDKHTLPTLTDTEAAKYAKIARQIKRTVRVWTDSRGMTATSFQQTPSNAHLAFHRDGTVTEHQYESQAEVARNAKAALAAQIDAHKAQA